MNTTCNKYSVFDENEVVEGETADKSVAHCEACDRDLKRAAPGLPWSDEESIGISLAKS